MKPYRFSAIILIAFLASMAAIAEEPGSYMFINNEVLDEYWVCENKIAPRYPQKSLSKGEEGCVVVGFVIEPDGTTSSHRAVVSSEKSFNSPAIRAAKKFTYIPSDKNTERVQVYTTNVFIFHFSRGKKGNEQMLEALSDRCNEAANELLNTSTGEAGG